VRIYVFYIDGCLNYYSLLVCRSLKIPQWADLKQWFLSSINFNIYKDGLQANFTFTWELAKREIFLWNVLPHKTGEKKTNVYSTL